MVLGVRLLSIFVDSKDLLPDVAMMSRSGTPCFESRCISLSPNGVCTVADELSLPLLEDCKASRASSPNWPSQPLLDSSVMVTFGLQLFVFVHDFPLEWTFLSASASRSVLLLLFFFFLSCMHVLPGRICRADKKVILPAAIGNGR